MNFMDNPKSDPNVPNSSLKTFLNKIRGSILSRICLGFSWGGSDHKRNGINFNHFVADKEKFMEFCDTKTGIDRENCL